MLVAALVCEVSRWHEISVSPQLHYVLERIESAFVNSVVFILCQYCSQYTTAIAINQFCPVLVDNYISIYIRDSKLY